MKTVLVTGSLGLIGSEVVERFIREGWKVDGVDNDQRQKFFGEEGSTTWRLQELRQLRGYDHHFLDIRNYTQMALILGRRPDAIIHCAGQPSHDLAAERPLENWEINVTATATLLDYARRHCPDAPFVFMSSNKIYGDKVNDLPMHEGETRYAYVDGLKMDENLTTHGTCRSIYGASKLAADVVVQEYGRYFGMPTVCLRGACLTGPNHSGVALHGFLNYMVKCNLSGSPYQVNNYKGKQVRDNIDASDVVDFMWRFVNAPKAGEFYNIGGGTGTDVSLLEAFAKIEAITGKPMVLDWTPHERKGDFIIWNTDHGKAARDYPGWGPTKMVDQMLSEIVNGLQGRQMVRVR